MKFHYHLSSKDAKVQNTVKNVKTLILRLYLKLEKDQLYIDFKVTHLFRFEFYKCF